MSAFCPSINTSISSSFFSHFYPKTSQISLTKRRNHPQFSRSISCKTTKSEDHNHNRRDVLIGLGGFYGATTLGLGQDQLAMAKPILPPDLTNCEKADLPAGVQPTNCCPPPSTNISDFKLASSNAPLRIRPAAHLADDAYLAKYTKAIELMKALPDDDPRSFKQQANIHCAYCDGAHNQLGFPDLDLQVHNSWLFFPFHRYYLHFHEKILGKLIDDPTFALPYWNWDSPDGMFLPTIYANPKSPLYDELRNKTHQPPTILDLDYDGSDDRTISNQDQVSSNLTVMYRQMVSNGKTPRLFLGESYRQGNEADPGGGSVENMPHGAVHIWTGDNTQPNLENMGNFYSAARDPIFFSHHSNIDRLWTIWKSLGGRRTDFTDPDWLDSGFIFYDENANLVRVKVRDCLDTKKLGYVYQEVDIPWLQSKPTPRKLVKKVSFSHQNRGQNVALAAETKKSTPITSFPFVLNKSISTMVRRPKKSRSKKDKEEEEEVLVIKGIEFEKDTAVKFDVYVNDEDDLPSGPSSSEFAGSFVNVPHKHKHSRKKTKTILRLGITDLLEDLDAEDDESVVITLVPRFGKGLVKIGGIKIEFARD
ncbi:polyphenol oxidase, chloroplastic-like [Euphorbia lathyris]|uniref:polyphenol oxidase, chloroplastic-like n=1 Tax=Euphorbia lathyris TaxID=212925 RepID=UPI003313F9A2